MDALLKLQESLSDRYDIKREIGAGGMATVYLAQDLRHDRPVALKLLNPELGAVLGAERFLAEIKVTANLQHPNLLPLFDSGAADGLLFYVMPFVDGETLRGKLDRERQLPVDEAVRMTVAIANALDYAHSHGVIHRDLKPENILLQAGQPVIADFGIALAVKNAGGNRITQTGLSLGTPQYMSPEQATGDRVIDGRSDIYSLGAVAYEMLTGEPPHTGSTSQAIIARMLTEKPRPMRVSRGAIPEHVELAVQHALEKLPADRFSSAHQFAEALHGTGGVGTTGVYSATQSGMRAATHRSWKSRVLDPVTLGAAGIALAALGYAAFGRPAPRPADRVVRFVVSAPDSLKPVTNYPWPAAISPDGGTIVYTANGEPGSTGSFYALRTDQLEAREIPGTSGAWEPSFSPDGQWLLFQSDGKIRKVRLDGSAPIAITDGGSANGGDWTTRDELVQGSDAEKRGLSKVSVAGGELTEIVKPDSTKGESDYIWPIGLPDGKRAAFTIWTGSLASATLATVSMDGGDVSRLGIKGIRPLAMLGRTLVYLQADGAVMAIKLNRSGTATDGKAIPVLDPVTVVAGNNGNSNIFVSPGGALVTARGGTKSQLSWIARDGTYKPLMKDARTYQSPRISPDGRKIAVVVAERDQSDIWIYDTETGTFSRLSSIKAATTPSWSPDGSKIFFAGIGDKQRFAIWSQQADGGSPAKKVVDASLTTHVTVAPDGKSLIYTSYHNNSWDLIRARLDSTPVGVSYMGSPANESAPSFSPDSRWVAFSSDESGRSEIYVRSYPDPSARVQISNAGGTEPVWSRDGTTLYYRGGPIRLAVKVSITPIVRVLSRDTLMTQTTALVNNALTIGYDIGRDGRYLGLISNREDYRLVAVPNWRAEFDRRIAASGKN
ncbi:MAG: LpqB family beta-propeller domain-containing protein [Gemmatimonadales bacterium]